MRRVVLLMAMAVMLSLGGAAQDSVTITSDPSDLSRPVSTLLDQLRRRERVSVTYEDPRYSNANDIEDVTSQVARNIFEVQKEYGPRTLVPKGKAITFVYSPQDLSSPDGAKAVIERMLREYSLLGGPTFVVVRDGVRLHVWPSEGLDGVGNKVRQESILDTIISVPPGRRDGGQLLQAICDQVKRQTGYEIGVGPSAPSNNLARYKTTRGIRHETARTALEHLLDRLALPNSFDWDLYYAPDDKSYGLNFAYIGPAGPAHTTR